MPEHRVEGVGVGGRLADNPAEDATATVQAAEMIDHQDNQKQKKFYDLDAMGFHLSQTKACIMFSLIISRLA
jgi:hypothetical protein